MTNAQHISSEDLALYAMHALSAEESAGIQEHLSNCQLCSEEVAQLRGDMALLALTVEQQPLPEPQQPWPRSAYLWVSRTAIWLTC